MQGKKWAYIAFVGALTCSTISACYWQTKKYLASVKRWDIIKQELNNQHPKELNSYNSIDQLYSFKYLAVRGTLSKLYAKVDRGKQGRTGYLVVRALDYTTKTGDKKQISALEGWCDSQFQYEPKQGLKGEQTFKGILREKQKKDFVHQKFKKEDLQKFNLSTYIDLQTIHQKLNMSRQPINQNYYIQLLRPLDSIDHDSFPYQYSVDNFQLPYLTPDKHFSYATFWGCSTLVGLFAIIKVLRFK